MNEKDAYIMHLENMIKDLQNQVSNLTEMIMLLRKDKRLQRTKSPGSFFYLMRQKSVRMLPYQNQSQEMLKAHQSMQLRMPSVHLRSEERIGCLLILPKEQRHQLRCIV